MLYPGSEKAVGERPMERREYRTILYSQVGRILLALLAGGGGVALSLTKISPFGAAPSGLLGLALAYGIGGKIFPDSAAVLSLRFRNYRRAQRGKPPIGAEEEIVGSNIDEFRKG